MKVRAWVAASIAALTWLSIAVPAQQPASALPYTVVSREARRPLAVRAAGGQEMFALDDLARLFNLTVRDDAAAGGILITSGSQTIVLSQQQPLASIAGRLISLPAAPVREGRSWLVPVDFVSRALAPISATRIDLRKPSRLILSGDIRMPRVASRVEALGSVTRVTIDVAPSTPHTVAQDGPRLVVRFDADALDAADLRATTTTDTLQGIRVGDVPQAITLDLGPRFASFRAADQPAPGGAVRIVIDLVAQTESAPQPGTPQPSPPTAPPPTSEAPPLLDLPQPGGLRTIVIDAGHGGDDTGAKGAQGTLEKNVALSVARKLKAAIEARLGVRVLLTRDGDHAVASDQRAALANNNKADLFISLHANASVRPAVSGAEVFYLNLEGYGEQGQRASQSASEALPVVGGGSREIEITPWEMAQARHIEQSQVTADKVTAVAVWTFDVLICKRRACALDQRASLAILDQSLIATHLMKNAVATTTSPMRIRKALAAKSRPVPSVMPSSVSIVPVGPHAPRRPAPTPPTIAIRTSRMINLQSREALAPITNRTASSRRRSCTE